MLGVFNSLGRTGTPTNASMSSGLGQNDRGGAVGIFSGVHSQAITNSRYTGFITFIYRVITLKSKIGHFVRIKAHNFHAVNRPFCKSIKWPNNRSTL